MAEHHSWSMKHWANLKMRFEEKKHGHCRKFRCKRDGLTIEGLLYFPKGRQENLPLAILSHGFMGNYQTIKKYAIAFTKMGFAALIFDFNGGGIRCHSEGKTEDMSVLTEVEDLKAVIKAASAFSFINKDELTLVGFSQGGFVSAIVARELQERIRRLILFYPALCIPDDARSGQMMGIRFDPQNVPARMQCGSMKIGREYVTSVLDMNAFEQIRDYQGPVLIIHGSKDEIVKPDYAKRAYQEYLNSHGGIPSQNCQLDMIDGANHGFSGSQSGRWDRDALTSIRNFLKGR